MDNVKLKVLLIEDDTVVSEYVRAKGINTNKECKHK